MSNIFDSLFIDTSNQQTFAEAQANDSRLKSELHAQDQDRAAAGTISPSQYATNERLVNDGPLQDPGSAASDAFLASATSFGGLIPGGLLGKPDPNDAEAGKNSPGVGSVLMDVFVIGAIGAGVWAFFKFGGTGFLKNLAKKSKYYVVGIAGAAVLLLWFIYSRFKKTASDTTSTVNGVTDSFKSLI